MNHSVLLVTADSRLAVRVTQALPPTLPARLHVAAGWSSAPDPRGWLFVVLDACAPVWSADPLPILSRAPALWLGQRPHLAAGARRAWPGWIADFLDREAPVTTLSFVLHQHLNAAYLFRMRRVGTPVANDTSMVEARERQCRINNALTGLLGNAELARAAHRRLTPPLARRLQNIAELTSELRELLGNAPPLDLAA